MTTVELAQIWGPIILAVGIGIFFSRGYYTRIYRDIEREPLATLVLGMFAMAIGLLHIRVHNVWDTFLQGIISFLGWATLLKGVLLLVAPRFVDKAGDWEVRHHLVITAGAITLLFGGYLTWVGYLVG